MFNAGKAGYCTHGYTGSNQKKKNQSGPDPSQQPSSTGVLGYSYPDDLLFRM